MSLLIEFGGPEGKVTSEIYSYKSVKFQVTFQ